MPNNLCGQEQQFESRHMDGVTPQSGRLFGISKRLQMTPQVVGQPESTGKGEM